MAETQPLVRSDIFDKAFGYTKADEVKALGFIVDRQQDRYVKTLSDCETAAMISRAKGFLGPCADYLIETSRHLENAGIPDEKLKTLVKLIDHID